VEEQAEDSRDSEESESKVASLPAYLITPPDLSEPKSPFPDPQLQQDMKQLQHDMIQLQQVIGTPEDGWKSDSSSSSEGVKITGAIPWGFKRDPLKPPRPLLTAKEKKKRRKNKEKERAAKERAAEEPLFPPPLEATKEKDAAASLAILQNVGKFTSRRGKEGVSTEHVKSEATSHYEEMNGSWVLPVKTDMDDVWVNPARPIERKLRDLPSTQSGDDTTKENSTIVKTASALEIKPTTSVDQGGNASIEESLASASSKGIPASQNTENAIRSKVDGSPEDAADDVSSADSPDDEYSISICGITGSVQETAYDEKPTPAPVISRKNIDPPATAPTTTHAPSAAREMMPPPDYAQQSDSALVNTPVHSQSATPDSASVLADSLSLEHSWVPRNDPKKDAEKQEKPPDPTLEQFEAHKLAWDAVVPPEKEIDTADRSLVIEDTWLPPHAESIKRVEEENEKQSSHEIADVQPSLRAMSDVPSPPEKAPPRSKQAVYTNKPRGVLPASPSKRKIPVQGRTGLLPSYPSNINIPVQGTAEWLPAPPSIRKIPAQGRSARVDFTGAVNGEQKDRHGTAADGQEACVESSSAYSFRSIDTTATQEPPRLLPGGRHGLPRNPSMADAVPEPCLADAILGLIDDLYVDQLEEQQPGSESDVGKAASTKQECKPGSKSGTNKPASQIAFGGLDAISGQSEMAKKASPKPCSSILKVLMIGTILLVCAAIAVVVVTFFD
jgi:hypothetical protein